jgi:hypothetical protein
VLEEWCIVPLCLRVKEQKCAILLPDRHVTARYEETRIPMGHLNGRNSQLAPISALDLRVPAGLHERGYACDQTPRIRAVVGKHIALILTA